MHITSLQNPLVKKVMKLQQKVSFRKKAGLFIAEGRREVSLAIGAGIHAEQLLVCSEIYKSDPFYPIGLDEGAQSVVLYVSRQVYNKLAYRQDAEGVILIGRIPVRSLMDLNLKDHPLILVLEKVEKPGNLGAILRTTDAAGADAVILTDPVTDIYNPNVIRASLGCVFTIPIVISNTQQAIDWLKKINATIYAAALQTDQYYYGVEMRKSTALVFGAEDSGLGESWRQAANQIIKIPMSGQIDSMNIAASVAVLVFEAVRQRKEIN
jgi:RNA methyltransferase, TrmH family